MRQLLIFMIIALSLPLVAAIYVNEAPDGSTLYTDEPNAQSKPVTPPAVNSISTPSGSTASAPAVSAPATMPAAPSAAPDVSAGTESGTNGPSTMATYKIFEIDTPKDQETISNQPVIGVQFKTDPNLKPGDKIQLYLDGKAVGTPSGNIYQELPTVERGTHTVYAAILNTQNQPVKRTNAITIFVHRNSVLTNPSNK